MSVRVAPSLSDILAEVDATLLLAAWRIVPPPPLPSFVACYAGRANDWLFVLARWERGGDSGWAGTAANPGAGIWIEMPPDLAARSGRLAVKGTAS
jgi:hypothetical protein